MGIFQRLFETAFPAFARTHPLPQHVHVAAQAVKTCRTAALGGHVRRCPAGHVTAVWYNSGGHRACPQCGLRRIGQWLDAWQQLLLPTGHFHVIFTLPSELHELWRWNRKAMATLLFRCVKETLFTLLDDPKRLGARPGVLATLHTWSRTLALHPHVHCLVTGGGVTRAGQWQAISTKYLLPVAIVRRLFQGKVLGEIERLWRTDQLVLPPTVNSDRLRQVLGQAARKKWNVRLVEQYRHGQGVVKYLARYVRGGPIKAQRVRAFNGQQVSLRTKLAGADVRLAVPEFLRRWSEHVPLPGFHMVRAWGLYAALLSASLEPRFSEERGIFPRKRAYYRSHLVSFLGSKISLLVCLFFVYSTNSICYKTLTAVAVRRHPTPASGAVPPAARAREFWNGPPLTSRRDCRGSPMGAVSHLWPLHADYRSLGARRRTTPRAAARNGIRRLLKSP